MRSRMSRAYAVAKQQCLAVQQCSVIQLLPSVDLHCMVLLSQHS